jgi:hypothetical protein
MQAPDFIALAVPAALMVFTDGQSYTRREGNLQALNIFDNLIAAKKMPVTIFGTAPWAFRQTPGQASG